MKLKLDENGHAVLQDGMPVYVHEDGKEAPFDAAGTVATIKARNAEAKANRERAETAESALKAFEGVDAEAARSAIEVVSKLDQKKLIDAGQVDAAVAAAIKPAQEKFEAEAKRAQALEQQLHHEIVDGSFARSKFIAEKLAIPADMIRATFGNRFHIAEGKLRATDAEGNPIYSRKNPGAAADFDEALEILVDAYPHKGTILKGTGASGSGAQGGVGGAHQAAKGNFGGSPEDRKAAIAAKFDLSAL